MSPLRGLHGAEFHTRSSVHEVSYTKFHTRSKAEFKWLLTLNAGILLVSLLVLLAPYAIITRISPAKVIRFE